MKYFLLCILILNIWAFLVEPNILTIKHITLNDKELKGLTVVFASDFHIKKYEKLRLKRIVKTINNQHPDIVLLGGDYVNGHRRGNSYPPDKIASELKNIKSKYGTLAVIGNHDGWQGKQRVIQPFEKNGIIILENSNKKFDKFTIAGVEDLQTGNPDIQQALKNAGSNVILLTHTPDMFPQAPASVKLTLAGHTHGGQIVLPDGRALVVPSKYGNRYAYGLKQENGKTLYVSRGLGTSTIAARFNCYPEIVVINFE